MAFLTMPALSPITPCCSKFSYQFTRSSPHFLNYLSKCCSAQTPLTPPQKRYYPRTTNYFRGTNLSRPCKPTFSVNIDRLLQTVAHTDRFIPVWNDKVVVATSHNSSHSAATDISVEAVFWTPSHLKSWVSKIRHNNLQPHFSPLSVALVHTASTPSAPLTNYFAVDVSSSPTPPTSSNQSVQSLRRALALIQDETHATLLAHANALISWHHSAVFCSRCGKPTAVTQSGMARACTNDTCLTKNIYPRIMPSILVLVLRNNGHEVLLGRKASWTQGRYSVLAGFAEIFESLEQTVVREVFEETGVSVDPTTIVYHSSQPWPSQPHASLLSGFRAHVTRPTHSQILVDRNELEDARWFKKTWLRAALESPAEEGPRFSIPGPTSLAHRLIHEWLHESVIGDGTVLA